MQAGSLPQVCYTAAAADTKPALQEGQAMATAVLQEGQAMATVVPQ